MQDLSRRIFTQNLLGSLCALMLVRTLCKAELVVSPVRPIADRWLLEMEEISRALMQGRAQPIEWQRNIEALLGRVELGDLLRAIDYDRMARTAVLPDDHESAEDIKFSNTEGLPAELSFAPYFYAMKKGRAIVPHGHRNMTTMHMVISGEAHAWHYDRIRDEKQHLIIKPATDRMCRPGDASTISDQHHNIHWFKALTEPVFMFNIGVIGINPAAPFTGRDYVDPRGGEKLQGGLIRARRLEVKEAYGLYGKS